MRSWHCSGIQEKICETKVEEKPELTKIARAEVKVDLGKRSYTIHISSDLLKSDDAGKLIVAAAPCSLACIVTHPGIVSTHANDLSLSLSKKGVKTVLVTLPAGERYKTLKTVEKLYGKFIEEKLDRKSLVIAVGGGVLGDVVGFAAATYLRGVNFVQIPTTLLAQVDSSVGGKTGVDLPAGKNLAGAFHQPKTVLIDPITLKTLPRREICAGLAEVIKYGIIYDRKFFLLLEAIVPDLIKRKDANLRDVISRSCRIKAEIVSQDETEQGIRAILNFGHTIGHALESVTHYRRYRHGEAIAIGMISAALIGEEMGVTPPEVTGAICKILKLAKLPTAFPEEIQSDEIIDASFRDKKTEGGKLKFVLAEEIGRVSVQSGVTPEIIRLALFRQKTGKFVDA